MNNITTIDARDLNEAWFLALKAVLNTGYEYEITRGSFKGHRRKELDYVNLRIKYPGTRPLTPTVPEGVPAPTTEERLNNYIPYLMTNKMMPNEQYTYGMDIVRQLPYIIYMLRESKEGNNQACMQVGDSNSVRLSDPQCLRVIDTRIRYGKLHFFVYFRSWDLWGGFPENLAGLQILKEYIASEVGVEDGELIAGSKGLHLYDHCWDLAKKVVNR